MEKEAGSELDQKILQDITAVVWALRNHQWSPWHWPLKL